MLSQVDQVVAFADASCNTELAVLHSLSAAAQKTDRMHRIMLMVELGDLREGIMPRDLENVVSKLIRLPNLELEGIGTNLACRSGVSPDDKNMGELSSIADRIDATFGPIIKTVSGGNSANLDWAFGTTKCGRVNNLRLGESLLLGCEPLNRKPIANLFTDAITLVAEVIESKRKPTQPTGEIAQSAFGEAPTVRDNGYITQSILALGRQDVDTAGLEAPLGISILAASSDHLVVDSTHYQGLLEVGNELSFQLNYSALLRAMTSPFIEKRVSKATFHRETEQSYHT